MSDPYPIDPNTDSSIDLATVIEVLADDPKVVGDRSDYHPTRGRVVKETPSGNRWLGDGDQWISLESDVGLSSPLVSTEQTQIGSASVVSGGPVGDAGDVMLLNTYPLPNGEVTTTSSTYTRVTSAGNRFQINYGAIRDLTNIDDIKISFVAEVNNSTSSTAYARIEDEPSTELTTGGSGFTFGESPRVTVSDNGTQWEHIELKTDDGEVAFRSGVLCVFGVIA